MVKSVVAVATPVLPIMSFKIEKSVGYINCVIYGTILYLLFDTDFDILLLFSLNFFESH